MRRNRFVAITLCAVLFSVFSSVVLLHYLLSEAVMPHPTVVRIGESAVDLVESLTGKEIFETVLRSIEKPRRSVIWNDPGEEAVQLCAVIVEPRAIDLLGHALWNMAHVYGNTAASLFVFHGTRNKQFVLDSIQKWQNVQLVNLGVAELEYPREINNLLMNVTGFWDHLAACQFALLFQADSIIRKRIDQVYFKYSYVGGPWIRKNAMRQDRVVGNGGFSLRSVKVLNGFFFLKPWFCA
jgi:hypothetical protein